MWRRSFPADLFPKLLVRLQAYVDVTQCWFDARTHAAAGAVLRGFNDRNRCLVRLDGEATLVIKSKGTFPTTLRGIVWRSLERLLSQTYDHHHWPIVLNVLQDVF